MHFLHVVVAVNLHQPAVQATARNKAILNAALSAGASGINKPVAVLDWLEKARPQEEYILILDADMIMRRPLDPVRLGVRPGAQPNGGF